MNNPKKLVKRIRVLTYVGDEAWVRTCTESPHNYVTDRVEFKRNGKVVKSITSDVMQIVDADEREL